MQRIIVGIGVLLIIVGLLWNVVPLFRLPGDFVFCSEGFRVYIPLATSILLSLLITLALWFFR